MCVVALAWKAHPDWPLVLIGNRDEFHNRPAAPLARWEDDPDIMAGRDLQSGGTWLGVSRHSRLAVITNRRDPKGPDPDKRSRGAIVTDALTNGIAQTEAEASLGQDYNGFSLLAVDQDTAWLIANRPSPQKTRLAPSLYALSNGDLDEPWPKTVRIKALLEQWLRGSDHDPAALLDGLRANDRPHVSPERASESPIFIDNRVYGTRCSTVVLVNRDGAGQIMERRFDSAARAVGDTHQSFQWRPLSR